MPKKKKKLTLKDRLNKFFKIIGPGVITGAADDDPSGIATYSQTGAQFGYGQLWMSFWVLPLMTAVQEACARIGAVTGTGLAAVIKKYYSKKMLTVAVFLVFAANTINIGADIGAMASALQLILPVNFMITTLLMTLLILVLEIFTSYKVYARILKWFALSLLAYIITMMLVKQPWGEIVRATLIPHFEFNFAFLFIITGLLGTTISPYMFFWEASEEVEEEKAKHLLRKSGRPRGLRKTIRDMRIDNALGMFFSQLVSWCIIVVTATVLHKNGVTNIATAADAAKALEPLVSGSGFLAKLIFSFGIIGLGLLAVPVLSGSASYALSEAMSWRQGLNLKLKRAHGFYGVITLATLLGLCINFVGIDPMQALVFAAVFNGVVAVPLLFFIGRIASNEKIMGEYKSGTLSKVFLWTAFAVMLMASVLMFFTLR